MTVPGTVFRRRAEPWQEAPEERGDAVTFLTVFAVLLLLVPSRLVFAPLGGSGSPALMLAVTGLVWWGHAVLTRAPALHPSRPARWVAAGWTAAVGASYVVAMSRPIDAVEVRAADRGILSVLALLGVLLVAADGIPTAERAERLLRRLVGLAGVVACVAVLQFFTGLDLVSYIRIPGLSADGYLVAMETRNGLNRPSATATHPIELGVVLAVVLPLALHFALRATAGRRTVPVLSVLVISLAALMSVSRSAVLASAVALAVFLPGLPRRQRRYTLLALPLVLVAVRLAAPGLIGTLRGLFTQIGSDPSAGSRTGAYDIVAPYIWQRPLFGRGFNTFLPSYHILDNQYLMTLIDTGIVGLSALLSLFVAAFLCAASAATRWPVHSERRGLARAVAAAVAAAAVGFLTFDALSFPMCAGLAALMIGCAFRLRLLAREEIPDPAGVDRHLARATTPAQG
ncbi:MAG: O-antigen ligase family protein [Motilibacteraceae bacterium]